ncbi:MAG: hypothetical protein QM770_13600 [Tepidisphaeraceae bacterium]
MNWPRRLGNVTTAWWICGTLAGAASLSLGPTFALAQPAPGTSTTASKYPFSVTAPNYTGGQATPVVDYVQKQADALAGKESDKWVDARRALLAPADDPNATPAFQAFYASTVNDKLSAVYSGAMPPGKLNMAIVAEGVARKSKSVALLPLISSLLAEDSPALVSWGLKAASPIVPQIQNNPVASNVQPFMQAIVAAPLKFLGSGEVIEDTYRALTFEMNQGQLPKPLQERAAPPLIDAVLGVLDNRLDAFKGGVPPAPRAELEAFRFLRNTWNFPTITKTQKADTLRGLDHLMMAVVQLLQAGGQPLQTERELRMLVNTIAKEALVIGGQDRLNDNGLRVIAEDLTRNSGQGTPIAALAASAGKLDTELNRVANVLSPASASQPATKPAP